MMLLAPSFQCTVVGLLRTESLLKIFLHHRISSCHPGKENLQELGVQCTGIAVLFLFLIFNDSDFYLFLILGCVKI